MRIVLDTNIYIAAALQDGLSRLVLEALTQTTENSLIVSEEILQELSTKLKTKFHWTEERINYFLKDISSTTEIVKITGKLSVITRDPKDNKILECALSGQANLIVTLDQDLIKLKTFRGIGIIHPKTLSWTLPEYFKKNSF